MPSTSWSSSPWRWQHYGCLKYRELFTQKTWIFSNTSVRIWNLASRSTPCYSLSRWSRMCVVLMFRSFMATFTKRSLNSTIVHADLLFSTSVPQMLLHLLTCHHHSFQLFSHRNLINCTNYTPAVGNRKMTGNQQQTCIYIYYTSIINTSDSIW
jgi:hypothetical protein